MSAINGPCNGKGVQKSTRREGRRKLNFKATVDMKETFDTIYTVLTTVLQLLIIKNYALFCTVQIILTFLFGMYDKLCVINSFIALLLLILYNTDFAKHC